MNNSELLEVARGMGKQAFSNKDNDIEVARFARLDLFNPSEGELIKWLLKNNYYINYIFEDGIEIVSVDEKRQLVSDLDDLKQNLLNIVLQVVRDK